MATRRKSSAKSILKSNFEFRKFIKSLLISFSITLFVCLGFIVFYWNKHGNIDFIKQNEALIMPVATASIAALLSAALGINIDSGGKSDTLAKTSPFIKNKIMTGEVVKVVDGDTVWVRTGGERASVRLFGIDAPESCQNGGQDAKKALEKLIGGAGAKVNVKATDIDKYGRTVAIIYRDKLDINQEMVAKGMAWAYSFNGKSEYQSHQDNAQKAKRGIFSNKRVENPSAFRKRHGPCYGKAK